MGPLCNTFRLYCRLTHLESALFRWVNLHYSPHFNVPSLAEVLFASENNCAKNETYISHECEMQREVQITFHALMKNRDIDKPNFNRSDETAIAWGFAGMSVLAHIACKKRFIF